jgi:hypothetical protein
MIIRQLLRSAPSIGLWLRVQQQLEPISYALEVLAAVIIHLLLIELLVTQAQTATKMA